MRTLDELVAEIQEWQRRQFPHANLDSAFDHLVDEVAELAENKRDGQEMADIVFLLIQMAACAGVELRDEIERKLEKNLARRWHPPDERGVVYHVKD